MNPYSPNQMAFHLVRWGARLWSALIFALVVLMVIVPDPNLAGPLPLKEVIEVGFIVLATAGLLLAWRWQSLGGWLTLAALVGHILAFRVYRGSFFGRELILIVFGLPAVLFLVEAWLKRERRHHQAAAVG